MQLSLVHVSLWLSPPHIVSHIPCSERMLKPGQAMRGERTSRLSWALSTRWTSLFFSLFLLLPSSRVMVMSPFKPILPSTPQIKEMKELALNLGLCNANNKRKKDVADEVIQFLRSSLPEVDHVVVKMYQRRAGKTGGVALAACPHGFVVAAKRIVRNESVYDMVDLLRSLENRPSLVFYDNADGLAAAIRDTEPEWFSEDHPLGLPVDPRQLVEALGVLAVRMTPMDRHPLDIRGMVILSDCFHVKNHTNRNTELRDPSNVVGTKGIINTEVMEQINRCFFPLPFWPARSQAPPSSPPLFHLSVALRPCVDDFLVHPVCYPDARPPSTPWVPTCTTHSSTPSSAT